MGTLIDIGLRLVPCQVIAKSGKHWAVLVQDTSLKGAKPFTEDQALIVCQADNLVDETIGRHAAIGGNLLYPTKEMQDILWPQYSPEGKYLGDILNTLLGELVDSSGLAHEIWFDAMRAAWLRISENSK